MKITTSLIIAATHVCATGAWAQQYPTRPVRMVVGFAPGGGTDIVARVIGQKLSEWLGPAGARRQPRRRHGHDRRRLRREGAADGYTLLMGHVNSHGDRAESSSRSCRTTPSKDFAPVAYVGYVPNVLVVHPSMPAQIGEGADRARESEAGRAQLRVVGRRQHPASRGRALQAPDRRENRARAVQGQRPGGHRPRSPGTCR